MTPTPHVKAELTAKQIKAGWEDTFSTNNPFCPCDLKSFTKAVNCAGRALAAHNPTVGEPLDMTSPGRRCINAAADVLSEVMAFVELGDDLAPKVSGALSGLRALQSIAPQAPAAEPVAMTVEERQRLSDTIDEFIDTGDTLTEYAVLLDWAARGLLECTHFIPTEAGRVAAAQAPGVRRDTT